MRKTFLSFETKHPFIPARSYVAGVVGGGEKSIPSGPGKVNYGNNTNNQTQQGGNLQYPFVSDRGVGASVNKVFLIGRALSAPKPLAGNRVVFSLVTASRRRDEIIGSKPSFRHERHNVVINEPNLCDYVNKNVQPGTRVHVQGSLSTSSFLVSGQLQYRVNISVGNRGTIIAIGVPRTTTTTKTTTSQKETEQLLVESIDPSKSSN